MKLLIHPKSRPVLGGGAGYTLVEALIASTIFCVLLVGCMVAMQIFGLHIYTLGGTKLSASTSALKVLDNVRNGVRSSYESDVGSLTTVTDPTTFVMCASNGPITGSALRVYPSTNTTTFSIYYLDTSTPTNYLQLATTTDGVTFTTTTLASYITNLVVFAEEDCTGNVLTNYNNNRIIRMELDFYQWEYPVGFVGGVGVNAYDYFRLTTRVSRRMLE